MLPQSDQIHFHSRTIVTKVTETLIDHLGFLEQHLRIG
jgi:hypothetical protein